MKFKWIGANHMKDIDLVLYKIMTPQEELMTGKIIEVPDKEKALIRRIKINGNYEVYVEPKKYIKPTKKDKKEEKEE